MADSQSQLDIVIRAVDEASAQVKQMATNVQGAMNQVAGATKTAQDANQNLSQSVFNGVAAWDMLKQGIGEGGILDPYPCRVIYRIDYCRQNG